MIQKYFKLFESTRAVELGHDEFIKILKENCKDFLKNPFLIQRNKVKLFGSNILTYSYIDPKKHNREQLKSYDGNGVVGNYSQLFMDNLESWKFFPKRSQSIIGVTNSRENLEFGEYVYIIIPFDGCKFGVSPHSDIWDVKNYNSISFSDVFSWAFYDEGITDSSYDKMLKGLYNLYKNGNIENDMSQVGIIFNFLDENNCTDISSMETLLSKYFSPSNLKFNDKSFELMNYSELSNIVVHREVWTDSECLILFIKKITFTEKLEEAENIRNTFNDFIKSIT